MHNDNLSKSMSLIIRALKEAQRELAIKLISHALPYQVCLYDEEGQTALHLAISKNYIDIAQKLLEKGANINAFASDPSYGYMTPLHYAALTGNLHATKLLLNWGASRHLENQRQMTASTLAYQHGFIEIARLIEKGNSHDHYSWPVNVPTKQFLPFNPKPLIESFESNKTPKREGKTTTTLNRTGNIIDFMAYKRSRFFK